MAINISEIFSTYDELKKKVMSIVTDSTPVDQPKNPDTCALFAIYSVFLNKDQKQELRARYLKPGLRYGDVKKELLEVMWNYFAPFREKRQEFADNPELVHRIMKQGAEKVRSVGMPYLEKARKAVGLNY